MNPVPDFGPEDVIDQPVLGDPAEALEGGAGNDGVEMVAVAVHFRSGAGKPGFDASLQLVGGRGHAVKGSEKPALYFVKQ